MLKKILVFVPLMLIMQIAGSAQTNLTLDYCKEQAVKMYPLTKQLTLIEKSKEYTVSNVYRGYWPQVSITGQATYQSAVTEMPIKLPTLKVDPLSKDQYKIFAEANQVVYDGGIICSQAEISSTSALADAQKTEVDLHKVKEQVTQIWFGILLMKEQISLTSLTLSDLQVTLTKITVGNENGLTSKSDVTLCQAEILKLKQKIIELQEAKKAYIAMLGLFINEKLPQDINLANPGNEEVNESIEVTRPEIKLFSFQKQIISEQNNIITGKVLPKLNLFFQGGYGKPGLNQLENSFSWYYVGGLRLSIPISGFYTYGNDRQLNTIASENLENQKQAFLLNTNILLRQQLADISKWQKLIETDDQIINLRTEVKTAAKNQLENGLMNANDYIRELNQEDNARQNKVLHTIQLLMAQQTVKLTAGN
ncbi:MAG: TolC family protein [Ignavibacteria bacterium]|nr:TolC family protein [Ignavibacteria bacterium]